MNESTHTAHRSQLMVFVKSPSEMIDPDQYSETLTVAARLLGLAQQLKAGKGLTLVCSLMKGDSTDTGARDGAAFWKAQLQV